MNLQETIKLFAMVAALFPRDNSFAKADRVMLETWSEMLADVPAQVAAAAVKAHASVSPFAPTISDIRAKALSITNPETRITGEELWGNVLNGVSRYGRNRKDEALAQIPDYARAFADRWFMEVCNASDAGVIRGQFLKAWEMHTSRKREDTLLPPSVRGFVAELASSKALELESQNRRLLNA